MMLEALMPDMERRVDFSVFRKLLQELEASDISIRVRMSGEGWRDYAKLILLSESAMILQKSDDRRMIMNVANIVEFEVDREVLGLQPGMKYEVDYQNP